LFILLTCFAAPSARAAATLNTLYSFSGPEGANPVGLIQGTDGNFYGRTEYGGDSYDGRHQTGYGTVFKMTPDGSVTNLHLFDSSDVVGRWPVAGLVLGPDGNLYGATTGGGLVGWGTIFSITPAGEFTTLTSFGAGAATSVLVPGRDGNFFSMADFGGEYGLGTLFRVTPQGSVTVLVSFDGTNGFTGFFANALVQGA